MIARWQISVNALLPLIRLLSQTLSLRDFRFAITAPLQTQSIDYFLTVLIYLLVDTSPQFQTLFTHLRSPCWKCAVACPLLTQNCQFLSLEIGFDNLMIFSIEIIIIIDDIPYKDQEEDNLILTPEDEEGRQP